MAEVVAKRYGTAFYDACEGPDAEACIAQLGDACRLLSSFVEALKNPVIEYERKETAVRKALKDFDKRVVNLVLLLIKNGHVDDIQGIYEYVNRLYMEAHRIKVVKVVSARPLKSGVIEAIERKLSEGMDYSLKLESEVDPAILGGLQLKFDDRILDLSVKNRLNLVRRSLQNVDVSR